MGWLSALGFGKKRDKADRGRYDTEVSERGTSETDQYQIDEHNVCGYPAFSDRGEQIGSVYDFVLDADGKLRYLVINAGFWARDKKILVPVGVVHIEEDRQQVILRGLTRPQVETMPAYDETQEFSEDYEANLMQSYYPNQRPYLTDTGRLDYERYSHFRTPERLRLFEERLQINKRQQFKGEVTIGKHVETRQETIEVPVTHERLVIERHPAGEGVTGTEETTGIAAGEMSMKDESMTVPLYTEEVEVTKRPVVSEEVTIRKEKETETRSVQETVRHEELDVNDPNNLATGERGTQAREGRGRQASDRGTEGTRRDPSTKSNKEKKADVRVDVIRTDDRS